MKTRTNQPITTFDLEDLEVSGKAKLFENIVDKDGHKRFIEGEGVKPASQTGITLTYNKWSLSGTHLMCVIAGSVTAGTYTSVIVNYDSMPTWIKDKIIGVSDNYIEFKSYPFYVGYLGQAVSIQISKSVNGGLVFAFTSSTTFSETKYFRIQYDLLIDNE